MASCLVTTRVLFQRKVEAMFDKLPALRAVLLIDGTDEDERDRVHALPCLMAEAVATLPDRVRRRRTTPP